jgi:hypothetical protein
LVLWIGTRTFIFDGTSPYSDRVTLDIQMFFYGRQAEPGENELEFPYPLYATIIMSPFAVIGDYNWARAVWMTALEVILFFLSVICLRLLDWRPNFWLLAVYFVFSLLWYHAIRTLVNGNIVLWVSLLIALALLAIRYQRDEIGGILLALATSKPNVIVLLIPFVLLWAISTRRWRLIVSTLGGILGLTAIGMIFIPNWPLQNLWHVMRYSSYNPIGTAGAAFMDWWPGVGRQLNWIFTFFLAAIFLNEWRFAWGKGFDHFLWTACLILVIGQWIGVQTDPGNFIVLFPVLTLVLASWQKRWKHYGNLWVLGCLLLLFVGLWVLFLQTLEYGDQPQQHAIMFFPLPLFLFIGLYWIRWWVVRPKQLFLEGT